MSAATHSNTFVFNGQQTIADLLLVAAALERAGHRPQLRFLRFRDDLDAVAVEFDPTQPRPEMVVSGAEVEPEPAGDHDRRWPPVTGSTPVTFNGEVTTWNTLSQNEKALCHFDDAGRLAGEYRF